MKALEIFEKVNLVAPMEQRRFFNYLNDTIRELMAMFTDCLFDEKTKPVSNEVVSDIVNKINARVAEEDSDNVAIVDSDGTYTANKDFLDFIIMQVVTYKEITLAQAKYVLKEKLRVDPQELPSFIPLGKLSDELPVFPLYCNAIVDNILFLSGQDASYKSEFLRKAENAHKRLWNDNAKGRFIKRLRW